MCKVMSPWWPFGRGFRASVEDPYLELEVRPVSSGWYWSVEKIVPQSGSFVTLKSGIVDSLDLAKTAATTAAGI